MERIATEPDLRTEACHTATVLVVEDEELVCEMTCEMLGQAGYEVLHAASAAEAKILFAEHGAGIDILFCDAVLPDGNGGALAESLAKQFPALKIVLCSGYPHASLKQLGIGSEAVEFLTKPYSGHAMLAAIRTVA